MPAGTKVARFDIASDNSAADIDLAVYRIVDAGPEVVATSPTGSGNEDVTLLDPEPGQYPSVVYPFADPDLPYLGYGEYVDGSRTLVEINWPRGERPTIQGRHR